MRGNIGAIALGFALAIAANLAAQYLANNVQAIRRAVSL